MTVWQAVATLGGVLLVIGVLGLGAVLTLGTFEPPLTWLPQLMQHLWMLPASLMAGAVLLVVALLMWAGRARSTSPHR